MRIPKVSIILLIAVVVVGAAIYLHETRPQSNPRSILTSTQGSSAIFAGVKTSVPNANWSLPSTATEQTTYGNINGQVVKGQITSDTAYSTHFEDLNTLTSQGYTADPNLSADGPGSSIWGYKKAENSKTQVVLFSYTTQASTSSPNEPLQFNCPCKVDLKVFVSDPFNEK